MLRHQQQHMELGVTNRNS